MLNLVFLLDITGSMESELQGVTKTVSELVKTVYADDAFSVMVTIITFTESARGCYVTNHNFTDGAKASAFVSSIKLCSPPGSPSITNANGGDGDENHKAALAELLLLDNTMPTIAFLISDAGPHLIADRCTAEAGQELEYLKRKHSIVYADMFHILELVQTHFGDNLILNVIKYIKNSDHAMYGAIAKKFNGVLITPQERRADKLAKGLMAILTKMFASFSGDTAGDGNGGYALDERALSAFAFYDVHDLILPASEADVQKNKQPEVGSMKKAMFELIQRATVIVGNKFNKRAIEATGLQEQVELLLVIAKCLTKTMSFNTALDRASALVAKIREVMPAENQGHFKIQEYDLPLLLSQEFESTLEVEAAVSAITLMGPAETALTSLGVDGNEEEKAAFEPRALIQTAAGLFLGHLAVLRLPEKNGKLDFMDSWSAVIAKMSNDIMSAADFLAIIGSDDAAAGLSIRANEYNYAQMFADPRDKVGSALLQVASGTQVLDIITALLAGAPAGLFSPNMFRGTVAASLVALVSQHDPPLTSYQRDIARKLVHSIRLLMGPKPKALKVDPEQPVSKLLFRLLRLEANESDKREAVRGFLQEMLATRIQNVLKWNPSAFLESVELMVGYKHVSAIEDVFKPHALDANMWTFDAVQASERIATRKMAQAFRVCAENALKVIYSNIGSDIESTSKTDKTGKKSVASSPSLEDIWPTFNADLPKYVLLHKRTARYTMEKSKVSMPASEIVWEDNYEVNKRLDDDSFAVLAMQLLRKKHDGFLRALRASRLDATAQQHWQLSIETMRAPFSEFVGRIEGFPSSACREHKLLLKAFKTFGPVMDIAEYEAKLQVLITGRCIHKGTGVERVVFNRGNLHPHPDRFVPMSDAFKAKLRQLQRERKWPLSHTYRPSDVPNHSGFSNSNPSEWAARRSNSAQTFWEEE